MNISKTNRNLKTSHNGHISEMKLTEIFPDSFFCSRHDLEYNGINSELVEW